MKQCLFTVTVLCLLPFLSGSACPNSGGDSNSDPKITPMVRGNAQFGCRLDDNGKVLCWNNASPYPILKKEILQGKKLASIACNLGTNEGWVTTNWGSLCGLMSDQKILCWGAAGYSRIGPKELTMLAGPFVEISADGDSYCALGQKIECYLLGKTSEGYSTEIPKGIIHKVSISDAGGIAVTFEGKLTQWTWSKKSLTQKLADYKSQSMFNLVAVSSGTAKIACGIAELSQNILCFEQTTGDPDYPNFDNAAATQGFGEIAVGGPDQICGLTAAAKTPVCYNEPAKKFDAVDNDKLASYVFTQISIGREIACGILKDTKAMMCWRSPVEKYPELPAALKAS